MPTMMAEIRASGVAGDRQRNLKYHGGPSRAVCLYSLERIRALQAEGHPIVPGSIGENLTLSGVDWDRMAPGVRIEIGDVLLELTTPAHPCRQIVASFSDGNSNRVSQNVHPGWSRYYARVLREGEITTGDPVTVHVKYA